MNNEEEIKTVFAFVTKGAKETEMQMNALLELHTKIKKQLVDLKNVYSEQTKELDVLNSKYKELTKTLDKGIKDGSIRKEFVKTKDAIKNMAETLDESGKTINATDQIISKLSDATKKASLSLKDMKTAQKELTKEFEGAKIGSEQYEKLSKDLILVKSSIKEVSDAEKEKNKAFNTSANSIEAMRKKVADLTKEWKTLDKSSPEFKQKAKELAQYNEELKRVEEEVGIFNRSVGDYKKAFDGLNGAIEKLTPSLQGAINPLNQLKNGFDKLAVTPLLATLTIIIASFKFLYDAMTRSVEGMEKLNVITSAFGTILDVISDKIAYFGEILIKAFTSPAKAWEMFVDGVKNSLNIFDEVSSKVKESMEIAKEENEIKKENIKLTVKIAENEKEIAKLKSDAYNKEAFTLQSREEMLQKALELEQENLNITLQKAKKELELFQRRSALSNDTIKDLEKEAEMKANLIKIEENYYNQTKKLRKELTDFKVQEETEAQKLQQIANDLYIKSLQDKKKAEEDLLKSKITGDEKQIELSKKILSIREKVFIDASKKNIKLTEEELLNIEVLNYEHTKRIEAMHEADRSKKEADFEKEKQKHVEEYTKMMLEVYNLEQKFNESKNAEERKYLNEKINETKSNIDKQISILKKYNIEASEIPIAYQKTFNKSQESIVESLNKTLQTIHTFSGQTTGIFGNLSVSVSGLVASMFELSNVKEKWGDDLEGMKEDIKRISSEITEMAASSLININQGIGQAISNNLSAQLEATKSYYQTETKIQQQALDQEKTALENKLKDQGVSEGKYRIEMFKLQEEQDKKKQELKKKEANELYAIQNKQFRAKQAQDAASAIIATALAVVQAFAQAGPFLGPIMAGIATAVGAAQVAAIYSQQPPPKPNFEKGGYLDKGGIIKGQPHSKGGVDISLGGNKIAEVEGNEGLLVVSKKAMQNPTMRSLFSATHSLNEKISGFNPNSDHFGQGGFLSVEDFKGQAKDELESEYQRKRKKATPLFAWTVKKYKDQDVQKRATELYNSYREDQINILKEREKAAEKQVNQGIQSNEYLSSQGITNIAEYNTVVSSSETRKNELEKEIKQQKDYADAKIELLKSQIGYEEKLLEFEERKKEAQKELNKTTLDLNKKYLNELLQSNQITQEDYEQMLDQITKGYGIKTQDIINLKKKEVEETKKIITEEYNFQKKALDQIRSDWKKEYNQITKDALDNLDNATEYVDKLTGVDLERYQSILNIHENIKKLEEDYKKNESIMTDGVIQSREERERMIAEQKRIKEEIKLKEKEQEEAKKKFEEERKKNEAAALSQYEEKNKEAILQAIKDQAEILKLESEKWSIDKEITAQYNQQIAAQDQIISNIENEYKQAQLLHDQKLANLKAEEEAFKSHFETQKKQIEEAFKKATENSQKEVNSLNAQLLAIKNAGAAAGIDNYEKILNNIANNLNNLPKFAEGGAISIGHGSFRAIGETDRMGGKGITMSIGGTPIAKVGGGENVIITNEQSSKDPRTIRAIEEISAINNYYNQGGIAPNLYEEKAIDYDLLANKVAASMNKVISKRPINAYITSSEIEKSLKNNALTHFRQKMK